MKIFNVHTIREADAFTIKNEPILSIDLMERAASACTKKIIEHLPIGCNVKIFCGIGNNGGDGLAIARLLHEMGISLTVYIFKYSDKFSIDFSINFKKIIKKNIPCSFINSNTDIPLFTEHDVIIDAIFGSGLNKAPEGNIAEAIHLINSSKCLVMSVDIPTGLFADDISLHDSIIKADFTFTFEFPKLSFMFSENEKYVGKFQIIPIGIHKDFINQTLSNNYYLLKKECKLLLKKRNLFSHKGSYGHALLIAGSYGKMGAVILASKACLRTGAGLISTHIPRSGYSILQTAFPENMVSIDDSEIYISKIPDLSPYSAIGIGPGIGMETPTSEALYFLLKHTTVPLVLDADALNILGMHKDWLTLLPSGSILTPHPKEFERIAGKFSNSFEGHGLLLEFSKKYNIYIILKGHHTAISCPDGTCFFNSTGNSGMATAGSGDVLTGIILGLLAQGYSPQNAAILGVFLHGLAGDIAAKNDGYEALIASDIIQNIGKAYHAIQYL